MSYMSAPKGLTPKSFFISFRRKGEFMKRVYPSMFFTPLSRFFIHHYTNMCRIKSHKIVHGISSIQSSLGVDGKHLFA